MRHGTIALVLLMALLTGCKRGRPAPTTTGSAPAREMTDRSGGELIIDREPDPNADQPPPTFDPSPPAWRGIGQPSGRRDPAPVPANPRFQPPVSHRGTLIISIYGTPLDYRLDHFRLKGNTFELRGQGMVFIGQSASREWQGMIGKPLVIESEVRGLGESFLDLPQVGKTRVRGGQIVFDETVSHDPPRVKGRISFALQGPDGPATFAGTFEVGVAIE